jgi:hypothetical protein
LSVKLLKADAVVGQVQEAVLLDGGLGQLDEVGDDLWIRGVQEGEVDGVEGGPVQVFFGGFWWVPGWDVGFA